MSMRMYLRQRVILMMGLAIGLVIVTGRAVMAVPSSVAPAVLDWSKAGLLGGEFPDTSWPVHQKISPSGGDDTALIQAALDGAAENSVIYLHAGIYHIQGWDALGKAGLTLDRKGIVLRGVGPGNDPSQSTIVQYVRGSSDGIRMGAGKSGSQTVQMLENVGLENLTLQYLNNDAVAVPSRHSIHMEACSGCWVKNVEVQNAASQAHVFMGDTAACSVVDNYFHDSFVVKDVVTYGILLKGKNVQSLVQNNIMEKVSQGISVQGEARGNVLAYNYLVAPANEGVSPVFLASAADEAVQAYMNLLEGNAASPVALENILKGGVQNKLFNNFILPVDPTVGRVVAAPEAAFVSLYMTPLVKPVWFADSSWPAVAPIPAQRCYVSSRLDKGGSFAPAVCYGPQQERLAYGDVNGDGVVSMYDAVLAVQYASGLDVASKDPAFNSAAAEVRRKGVVTSEDARLISQKVVGTIVKFPVEL